MKIKDLKEQRAKLIKEARDIQDLAEKEKRELTSEESTRQDTIFAESDKIGVEVERLERLAKLELEERALREKEEKTENRNISHDDPPVIAPEIRKLHTKALRAFICGGPAALTPEMVDAVRTVAVALEAREMSAFGAAQSVMLAPQEWSNQLIADLTKKVAVRSMASVFSVTTLAGLGVPTLAEDTEEFDMTPELTAPSQAADISLGKRELRPHQASKMIKLPVTLLQSSSYDIEGLANRLLGDKFARTEDNKYCNGSGAQEPLGLFTASDFGIGTDRDVVTGGTTNYAFDNILDVIEALREEYRVGGKFLLPRGGMTRIRKIKDGEGRYILEPSVQAGNPDSLFGFGVQVSDFVPATFTSGLYVGMFGNFSWYWIVDFAFTYLQKLSELYALTNQVALIGRRWFDGAPVQPKAFVRMKLG